MARKRIQELLVAHATEGLGPDLAGELEELLPQCPDLDPESFELAAALIDLACTAREEALPASLRRRLARQARHFYRAGRSAQ